jgi:hypothetical protein
MGRVLRIFADNKKILDLRSGKRVEHNYVAGSAERENL